MSEPFVFLDDSRREEARSRLFTDLVGTVVARDGQVIIDVVDPQNYVWHWPTAFARGFAPKLVDDGLISAERAEQALNALTEAETGAGTRMITPVVLEIVARRR